MKMLMCLFMFVLYNKIKIEIDINNDELLDLTIWEHMKEIKKKGRGGIIKLINLHPLHHCFYLFFTSSKVNFEFNLNIYLTISVHSINLELFPQPCRFIIKGKIDIHIEHNIPCYIFIFHHVRLFMELHHVNYNVAFIFPTKYCTTRVTQNDELAHSHEEHYTFVNYMTLHSFYLYYKVFRSFMLFTSYSFLTIKIMIIKEELSMGRL